MESAAQSTRGKPRPRATALTIAGSDSGGGAGIEADLKTFHAWGVFGTVAITAVTAQDTTGVHAVATVDSDLVARQIECVAQDVGPDACKTGMLGSVPVARAVVTALSRGSIPHLVVDPVMVATSGARLLEPGAVAVLLEGLLPRASLITPNLDEAELLCGWPVRDEDGMRRAAHHLLSLGCGAALVKGGHLTGPESLDLLAYPGGERIWRAPRLQIGDVHGTGCTLSAAITAGLALGQPLIEAVDEGLAYTRRALEAVLRPGHGAAVLNHWV